MPAANNLMFPDIAGSFQRGQEHGLRLARAGMEVDEARRNQERQQQIEPLRQAAVAGDQTAMTKLTGLDPAEATRTQQAMLGQQEAQLTTARRTVDTIGRAVAGATTPQAWDSAVDNLVTMGVIDGQTADRYRGRFDMRDSVLGQLREVQQTLELEAQRRIAGLAGAQGAEAPAGGVATAAGDRTVTPAGVSQGARGVRNNNPLNITFTGNRELQVESDGRFGRYASPEAGFADATRLLQSYQNRGINTVQGIINRWAPPSENNTSAYVNSVANALGVRPDQPINLSDPAVLQRLLPAMATVENGGNPYSADVISRGVAMGLNAQSMAQGNLTPVAATPPQGQTPAAAPAQGGTVSRRDVIGALANVPGQLGTVARLATERPPGGYRPLTDSERQQYPNIDPNYYQVNTETNQIERIGGTTGRATERYRPLTQEERSAYPQLDPSRFQVNEGTGRIEEIGRTTASGVTATSMANLVAREYARLSRDTRWRRRSTEERMQEARSVVAQITGSNIRDVPTPDEDALASPAAEGEEGAPQTAAAGAQAPASPAQAPAVPVVAQEVPRRANGSIDIERLAPGAVYRGANGTNYRVNPRTRQFEPVE